MQDIRETGLYVYYNWWGNDGDGVITAGPVPPSSAWSGQVIIEAHPPPSSPACITIIIPSYYYFIHPLSLSLSVYIYIILFFLPSLSSLKHFFHGSFLLSAGIKTKRYMCLPLSLHYSLSIMAVHQLDSLVDVHQMDRTVQYNTDSYHAMTSVTKWKFFNGNKRNLWQGEWRREGMASYLNNARVISRPRCHQYFNPSTAPISTSVSQSNSPFPILHSLLLNFFQIFPSCNEEIYSWRGGNRNGTLFPFDAKN